jgi:hypothetical protein
LLGIVAVEVDLRMVETRASNIHKGWVSIPRTQTIFLLLVQLLGQLCLSFKNADDLISPNNLAVGSSSSSSANTSTWSLHFYKQDIFVYFNFILLFLFLKIRKKIALSRAKV